MNRSLKWYHIFLTFILVPLCLYRSAAGGWMIYANMTRRPGMNGSMYARYDMTPLQYSVYESVVSIAFLIFGVLMAYHTFTRHPRLLTKLFWYCLLFFVLTITFMAVRFTPKG
jgi:hypothetical protein